MQRIGLLADTHGYLDPQIFEFFEACDEIWHAGDFGTLAVAQRLAEFKPMRGVFGNVDDEAIRDAYPLDQRFHCEQLDVWMTHIGGYPGKYERRVSRLIRKNPPGLFVCGHSHILRVMRDKRLNGMLHLNPGAAGRQGFHLVRTMLRLEVTGDRISKLQAVELGKR